MARKKKAPKPEFPEQLYVVHDYEDPDTLYALETTEHNSDGERIGVYSLDTIVTKKVYSKLE